MVGQNLKNKSGLIKCRYQDKIDLSSNLKIGYPNFIGEIGEKGFFPAQLWLRWTGPLWVMTKWRIRLGKFEVTGLAVTDARI